MRLREAENENTKGGARERERAAIGHKINIKKKYYCKDCCTSVNVIATAYMVSDLDKIKVKQAHYHNYIVSFFFFFVLFSIG